MPKNYFDALRDIMNNGLSFEGKVALITGIPTPYAWLQHLVFMFLAGGLRPSDLQ